MYKMENGTSYMLTFVNYFLPELVHRLDSPSHLHCASLCSLHLGCQSFFYQHATKACVPVEQMYVTTKGLGRQSGWQYFLKKGKDVSPSFKVILKTRTESSIFDWSLQEWSPFKTELPEFINDFSFDGGEDLYSCAGSEIDLMSLKSGKLIQLGEWHSIESIYAIAVDLKNQYVFYATLLTDYELNRMNPLYKNTSVSVHRSSESFALWLTLDRERKRVFATGSRGKEFWVVSMKYDGSGDEDFLLFSEKITDIVFDKKDNALLFTASTGVYSYILSKKKKIQISSLVSSPKQIDMFGDFIVIVNETVTHSSLVILSRKGEVLDDLENPNGFHNYPFCCPSRIQVLY